jgi:hypothetical protein
MLCCELWTLSIKPWLHSLMYLQRRWRTIKVDTQLANDI